jgi:two-component system cell cycle response regulator
MARILVIEDNADNLDLMSYLLEAFGHTILTAQDGEEGLEMIQQETPDLILCDVHLPGIDGYEVARWLKGHPRLHSIPLIAVTALAMVGDRGRILAAGFEGYLAKPIAPETFVGEVERFLQRVDRAPTLTPQLPTPGIPSTSDTPPARGTLLVVDDTTMNLELALSIFEPSGYHVLTASSMREALELARQALPNLILSDVNMMEGLGYQFLAAVKADPQLRTIPFVFITSTFVEADHRAHGLALGAARFITRPIEPQLLLAQVEACLEEAH